MSVKSNINKQCKFKVEQYYLLNGEVKSHIYSTEKTLQEAHSDLTEAYKMFPDQFIVFPGIPSKTKDELVRFILERNKDKSILTIVSL